MGPSINAVHVPPTGGDPQSSTAHPPHSARGRCLADRQRRPLPAAHTAPRAALGCGAVGVEVLGRVASCRAYGLNGSRRVCWRVVAVDSNSYEAVIVSDAGISSASRTKAWYGVDAIALVAEIS